ncbi:MAG TPA: twin-arginine translocation signal domain-containing protein [Alphaproteobacteria bacterium]|nr:twin-arginine translocation signal domain-containing protein [Alphaproteobacteria bacterium]
MRNTEAKAKVASRRDFLKLAGAGAGVAAAHGLTSPAAAEAAETPPGRAEAGYHESEHVKKYYALARF